MAIEYSLNKIKNFFVGKDILGRDAIVHSRVTFLMKRVPKEMADATRAGYLMFRQFTVSGYWRLG